MIVNRAEAIVALNLTSATDAQLALLDMVLPLADGSLKSYMQQEIERAVYTEYLPMGQEPSDYDAKLDDATKTGDRVTFDNRPGGRESLQLKHLPVLVSSIEVYEDIGGYAGQSSGAFAASTLLTKGTDYFVDADDGDLDISRTGLLIRASGVWPTIPRSIKVVYYGGFTQAQLANGIGGAVKHAALLTVVAAYKQLQAAQGAGVGPLQSESIGKYSYSNAAGSIAATSMTLDLPAAAKMLLQPFRNYGRLFA